MAQELQLTDFLTAKENVALGLDLRGVQTAESSERALEALRSVGLADVASRRVGELSGGQRERVAIARAVAPRPRLLLVDEPTARLDQANALAVASLFVSLARSADAVVVCATHDPLLVDHADDRVVLRSGERSADGRPVDR